MGERRVGAGRHGRRPVRRSAGFGAWVAGQAKARILAVSAAQPKAGILAIAAAQPKPRILAIAAAQPKARIMAFAAAQPKPRIIAMVAVTGTVLAASSAYALAHGRPATASAGTPDAVGGAAPLQVVSVTPEAGAAGVNGDEPVQITFSAPLATGSPMPRLSPPVQGSWQQAGAMTVFTPAVPVGPSRRVTVTIPAGPGGVRGTTGAILARPLMAFQSDHRLAITGVAGPALWNAVFKATAAGADNRTGYTYAVASKGSPETLTIWHDGRVVLSSAANTGIPVTPTADGTFPVYLRYRFQVMQGTNPDGSHYADPVSFVAYFNGGEAVHYFPRGSYGFQQSLGCVELPYWAAEVAWPYLSYGSLITVSG
jgi:peptidoglycan hydrolase-like protein with peptidoglycan-binding domain